MGHLIPYYMLMNAGYQNNMEDDDESTSSSDKPLENKSVTSSKTTDALELRRSQLVLINQLKMKISHRVKR